MNLPDGFLGAEAFDVVLPDSEGRFFLFGMDGSGYECISLYAEADTDTEPGDDICEGFTVDGEPDIYGALHLPHHRVLVGGRDGDGWIGVQSLTGEPDEVIYSETYDDIDLMLDVARYGIDGFIAVGQEGKIVTTAALDPANAPDGRQQLDPGESAWVEINAITEALMDEGSTLPHLRAVTRLGAGNVIVGDDDDGGDDNHDQPVVWVFRPKPPDPSGDLGWDRWLPMELANATDVDLYGVSVDEVHGHMRKDPTSSTEGDRVNDHRGFVLAVGTQGKTFRFEVRLTDERAGSDGDMDDIFTPHTQAFRQWGGAYSVYKLYDVWTDERTRIVVGDNGLTGSSRRPVVITLARTEDFATSPHWLGRAPGSEPITLTGVASNSNHYWAVGFKPADSTGRLYVGHEAVIQCSVRATLSGGVWNTSLLPCFQGEPAIPNATDIEIGDGLVSLTRGGEMTFDDLGISALDTDMNIEIDIDPDAKLQTWELGFQGESDTDSDTDPFQVEVAVVPDLASDTDLGRDIFMCRYPGGSASLQGFQDLIYETSWRRDSLQYFPSSYTRYRLYRDSGEGIPYQVPSVGDEDLDSQKFADILTGWMVDDRDDTTPSQLEGGDLEPVEDNPWCPEPRVFDLEEDGLSWADDTDLPEDVDLTGDGPEALLYGISRYRNIIGHPMVDDYEGFKDGMEWRYMRQRNDFFGLCERGPDPVRAPPEYVDYWTETCCRYRGAEWADDANTDEDTELEDTEPGAEDTDALVPDTTLYLDIFAPIDGTVHLLPDPGEIAPCACENDLDSEEDRCELCEDTDVEDVASVNCIDEGIITDNYGGGGVETSPCHFLDGVPRKASKLPYPSMNIAVVNRQGNVLFRLLHVETCVENGTEVLAGQRIGRASAWQEMDVEVWYNSDRDRWRAISYFDLLPDALYQIYVAKFGFDARGTGRPRDPVIPLEQRDACPGLPVFDDPEEDNGEDTDLLPQTPLDHPDPQGLIVGCDAVDFAVSGSPPPGDFPTCPSTTCTTLPGALSTPCIGVRCEEVTDTDTIPECPCAGAPEGTSGTMPLCQEGWTGCDVDAGDTDTSDDCTCTWVLGGELPPCMICSSPTSCVQPECPTNLIRRMDIGGAL